MTNELIQKLDECLRSIGIQHPVYLFALLGIPLLFVVYGKDLRNWRKQDRTHKVILANVVITAVLGLLFCILMLIGAIKD